jgi:hypothetical protein
MGDIISSLGTERATLPTGSNIILKFEILQLKESYEVVILMSCGGMAL